MTPDSIANVNIGTFSNYVCWICVLLLDARNSATSATSRGLIFSMAL